MPPFIRSGSRGHGSAIRAIGPHVRLCQQPDRADGKRPAPSIFHEPCPTETPDGVNDPLAPNDGTRDRSWGASMADRVVTRADARIIRTLRGPLHLQGINGPLWTARKARNGEPAKPEVDVMSTDGIVNPHE